MTFWMGPKHPTPINDFWRAADARRAHNQARHNRRSHGIPDPDHDFTGAAKWDYDAHCRQGIHRLGPDNRTCEICGDLLRGVPSDLPTTNVAGSSTRLSRPTARVVSDAAPVIGSVILGARATEMEGLPRR